MIKKILGWIRCLFKPHSWRYCSTGWKCEHCETKKTGTVNFEDISSSVSLNGFSALKK